MPRMHPSATDPIDTRQFDFLSSGPPFGERQLGMEEFRVAVGPDSGDRPAAIQPQFKAVFPLRRAKVQRPLLPDDTVRRDRLLDWMASRIRCRIIYVVAEAGFGKTTLIADFARRSRIRTFWYRLDEDDTDGLVFLRYVVASCRVVDPRLFCETNALLTEPSIEPMSLESMIDTFMAEFEQLGDAPSMLVLDDYYLAEKVASIRSTVERMIARAPANLTFVFATRRTPPLSVATLRARNELAELGTSELLFEMAETGQLFAQGYRRPLDADVLEDVQARTGGWAASLQLVKTAVEGRTPAQIRAFVRSMSGAEGHLYDYLAQEVVGELDPDLRHFLPRAALLDEIEVETSAQVTGVSEPMARRLIGEAERVGLMSHSEGAVSSWRPHPLVREFLMAGLEQEIGAEGIVDLHRHAAAIFEPISWRLAARHWAVAGDTAEVRRVLSSAVPSIITTGDLGVAEELMNSYPDPNPNPWYEVLKARVMLGHGRAREAKDLAQGVAKDASLGSDRGILLAATLSQLTASLEASDTDGVRSTVAQLRDCGDEEIASIARSSEAMCDASDAGDLEELARILRRTITLSRNRNHSRFEAIGLINESCVLRLLLEPEHSAKSALGALECLSVTGSIPDIAAARLNEAASLADLGDWAGATEQVELALSQRGGLVPTDAFLDASILHAQYGDPETAARYLDASSSTRWECESSGLRSVAMAAVEHALGNREQAAQLLAAAPKSDGLFVALRSAVLALQVQLDALNRPQDPSLAEEVSSALQFAADQKAWLHWHTIRLVQVSLFDPSGLSGHIRGLGETRANQLSIAADVVAAHLDDLDDEAFKVVSDEVNRRPDRWRPVLRRLVDHPRDGKTRSRRAVVLLEQIGLAEDVARLRAVRQDKRLGMPNAGRALIRRLAPRAYVEDLGHLSIRIGDRTVPGAEIRKKVLSLLGFLLTRPQYCATREQIQDALWPELDPTAAANSLNQTCYFLRHVFEPTYKEGSTAGYLASKGDLIWLDSELIDCRSSACQRLLADLRRDPKPVLVAQLAAIYTAEFGTDFRYDEWSAAYRDHIHAAFLDRIERSLYEDLEIGAFERGIALAQQALMADPDADRIELLLIRLYRATGAHSAAAEQYSHYASAMRNQLGVEPPLLESL